MTRTAAPGEDPRRVDWTTGIGRRHGTTSEVLCDRAEPESIRESAGTEFDCLNVYNKAIS